ncbi:hypothetical protein Pla108_13910 [Botrimarina colliarenosi]|uniref:Transposase DDE domain-containing protein n=1 Tax=Botrimarina colliarenosi TaxID=2528001 RepID=A0A5C6ALB9_9BACT|nr:IS5 family transposase [Botrimarina colliarenosi]TWU00440.1 hypothetical protein Pla108_13910 [Botrimarina colliarenosi]
MAASKAKKKSHRVTNWREYNESLVRRGDITFWFSVEVLAAWDHDNPEARRGHPFIYSDLAIETLRTLRELFRLPYRQTEGLDRALAKLMGVEVAIPHHTSLVKRAAKLDIDTELTNVKGPIDVVVHSTGLQVFGEGEWKVRQHGVGKRRDWRKVHFAVDPDSHAILAELMTDSRTHDATAAKPLLKRVDQENRDLLRRRGCSANDQPSVFSGAGLPHLSPQSRRFLPGPQRGVKKISAELCRWGAPPRQPVSEACHRCGKRRACCR